VTPKVTIGLAIFNGAATLQIAIKSILSQTYKHWELLLIDVALLGFNVGSSRRPDDLYCQAAILNKREIF